MTSARLPPWLKRWLLIWVLAALPQITAAAPRATPSCDENKACRAVNDEAVSLFKQLRYKEALDKFQAAYALAPSANLLLSIGRTLYRLKDYDGSIQYLTRYQGTREAADPQQAPKLARFLAEAHDAQQRLTQAREQGLAKLAEGRYAEALDALKVAQELRPDPEHLLAQGQALQALQRYAEASTTYRDCLQLMGPEHPRRREATVRLTESDAEQERQQTAAAASVAQTGPTGPPAGTPAAAACQADPGCQRAMLAPTAPPAPLRPAYRPEPLPEPDRDLDDLSRSAKVSKPLYKSAGLWVGVSLAAAALIGAIVVGVSLSAPSTTPYKVTWQ